MGHHSLQIQYFQVLVYDSKEANFPFLNMLTNKKTNHEQESYEHYLQLCRLTNYSIREFNEYLTNSTNRFANNPTNFTNYRPVVDSDLHLPPCILSAVPPCILSALLLSLGWRLWTPSL
jgi:hypothetical protein